MNKEQFKDHIRNKPFHFEGNENVVYQWPSKIEIAPVLPFYDFNEDKWEQILFGTDETENGLKVVLQTFSYHLDSTSDEGFVLINELEEEKRYLFSSRKPPQ
jgi:hypothetical protein